MAALWRVIRRILKWGGFALLALLLLACALWTVALAINAHDEELTAQARALLTAPANPIAPQENIYVALAGFDAPPGESVTALGQAKIDYYNQHVDALLRDSSAGVPASLKTTQDVRLDFKGDIGFAKPAESSVWSDVPSHAQDIENLLVANRELYERYLALQQLRGYHETARPTYLAPTYSVPSPVRKLFLAKLVLRLRTGAASAWPAALADLQGDLRVWRAVLDGDGELISKLFAIANLEADYLVLADMIADPQIPVPLGERDADSIAPVYALSSWDIGSALAAKFRMLSSVFGHADKVTSGRLDRSDGDPWLSAIRTWAASRFFKMNATENQVARQTARRIAAAADPVTFRRTRDEPGVWLPEDPGSTPWPLGYNSFGKILAGLDDPHTDNYVLRAWDGAALQRLVRLGYEIRRQQIDAAAMPAFLGQHPEWGTHPADGRAFLWDATSGEIRIQTMAEQPSARRFFIRIWRAPSH